MYGATATGVGGAWVGGLYDGYASGFADRDGTGGPVEWRGWDIECEGCADSKFGTDGGKGGRGPQGSEPKLHSGGGTEERSMNVGGGRIAGQFGAFAACVALGTVGGKKCASS